MQVDIVPREEREDPPQHAPALPASGIPAPGALALHCTSGHLQVSGTLDKPLSAAADPWH